MKLIIGLGNPGKDYENTRHNIGFMILDNYLGEVKWKEKFQGEYYEAIQNGEKIIFLKPLTFMNLSGNSIVQYVKYFDIAVEDILVIHDDMDIEFGKYKLKKNSSSGGHNGIKSIISSLGTDEFLRLKIGIAHDRSLETKDYVLGKFNNKQLKGIEDSYDTYNDIIDSFISNGIEKTMNIYNTK